MTVGLTYVYLTSSTGANATRSASNSIVTDCFATGLASRRATVMQQKRELRSFFGVFSFFILLYFFKLCLYCLNSFVLIKFFEIGFKKGLRNV